MTALATTNIQFMAAAPGLASSAGSLGDDALSTFGDDAARVAGAEAAAPIGDDAFDFAIGLARHQTTKSPTLLENFTKHVGAKHYGDIYRHWWPGSYEKLARNVTTALNDAKHIHVNLDGVVKCVDDLPNIIQRGAKGIDYQEWAENGMISNITNWEISTIMANPALKSKATFYLGGKEVSIP